jgi:hypothetical protein
VVLDRSLAVPLLALQPRDLCLCFRQVPSSRIQFFVASQPELHVRQCRAKGGCLVIEALQCEDVLHLAH